MKNRRKMTEIVMLCLSATITLGLSINTIIQSNKKEKELNQKQEELLGTQKKVSAQAEEIIQLQKKLQDKSEIQIKNLEKLNNPIPSEFTISFFSKIKVTKLEMERLSTISKSNGNLLPSTKEDSGVFRIDRLKDAQLIIEITFTKDSKELKVKYSQSPFLFMGYSTSQITGIGTLVTGVDELNFYAINLSTKNIKTNYLSPSLLDFHNSEVTVEITFAYAKPYINGGKYVNLYLIENEDPISILLDNISMETNQSSITIDNFKKLKKNIFKAHWKN